jgi:hypothetical protein
MRCQFSREERPNKVDINGCQVGPLRLLTITSVGKDFIVSMNAAVGDYIWDLSILRKWNGFLEQSDLVFPFGRVTFDEFHTLCKLARIVYVILWFENLPRKFCFKFLPSCDVKVADADKGSAIYVCQPNILNWYSNGSVPCSNKGANISFTESVCTYIIVGQGITAIG